MEIRLIESWGDETIIVHDELYRPAVLPGFVAFAASESESFIPYGLITYIIQDNRCEIITLNSWAEGVGIGTGLIEAVKAAAIAAGCTALWLITTNDNLNALGFYQKRGFQITAVYPNAIVRSRKRKPQIPEIGMHDIPLRDEIELTFNLS